MTLYMLRYRPSSNDGEQWLAVLNLNIFIYQCHFCMDSTAVMLFLTFLFCLSQHVSDKVVDLLYVTVIHTLKKRILHASTFLIVRLKQGKIVKIWKL